MSDDFYSSMYGPRAAAPKGPVQAGPKPIPPAHRRLSGLKLTGSHMHEIDLPNGTVGTIPSAAYVKLLEDQIKSFRQMVQMQADDIRRTNRNVTALQRELAKVRLELDKTVKIR
jgi:hypothetical protein